MRHEIDENSTYFLLIPQELTNEKDIVIIM